MARQPTYTSALRSALAGLPQQPADKAAVRLAYGYAQTLDDDPAQIGKVGPLLLACLTTLAMTPAGRAAIIGKGEQRGQPTASPLDELRARRAARQR